MTAYNLYPEFIDREGYLGWRKAWRRQYLELAAQVKERKNHIKERQRSGDAGAAKQQSVLFHYSGVARKMMTLLDEAKKRRDRILTMQADIKAQGFPLDLGVCRAVDFHYNRGHSEFPFLPMWAIRVKGRSYYVEQVDSEVPWTTKGRNSGSTKGVLRFPKCRVSINSDGIAKITLDQKTIST